MPEGHTKIQTIKDAEIVEDLLQLDNRLYQLRAIFFKWWQPLSPNQKQVQVLVVDKNGSNPQQFLLKLNLVQFAQLNLFAEENGAKTFTSKSEFNNHVEKTKKSLPSADKKTTSTKLILSLRFV